MLVMLLPEQLDKFWPHVRFVLEASFQEEIVERQNLLNNVLHSLLTSSMHAWIYTKDEDSIDAIVLTSILEDSAISGRILRLYLLYSFKPMTQEAWLDGWNTMQKFAVGAGCTQMEAFSSNSAVIAQAEKMGWKSEHHLYKEL